MEATIQTKWNHNPGSVYIVAQKRLDRRDRSEPSYEHKLLSSVPGGGRCPQLTRLYIGRLTAAALIVMLTTSVCHDN